MEEIATQERFVYVSLDYCMAFHLVKLQVLENLEKALPGMYTWENVILSGTHTHSTPGGVGATALIEISTLGFVQHNFDAVVNGIVSAIEQASASVQPGVVRVISGELHNSNINRSPTAYLFDPEEERAQYEYNTEQEMTLLRFESINGEELGMVNFFSVHGTSMNNTNLLVSSDNKGYASILFEQAKNPNDLIGKGKFVAAFGQTNEGDSSPNTAGPSCPDGSPCNSVHSTCGGKNEGCTAKGPGKDMFDSTKIIATMQFKTAMKLYQNVSGQEVITGKIDKRHTFVNMQTVQIDAAFSSTGQPATTCLAALGYAFAAGTTDGPGEFDFTQGSNSSNPFWNLLSGFLAKPTADQIKCQAPKPILLDVSLIKPTEWVPYILPLQIVRLGQLYLVAVPGEFTTMAGRRLRATIKDALLKNGAWKPNTRIVISGLANSYAHYTTTYQEYQAQRYEGGSTLYGPHQLDAYQQSYYSVATAMATGQPVEFGPMPMDMRGHTFSFVLPVLVDDKPARKHFGSVMHDVQKSYTVGEVVQTSFWGASPRNDVLAGKTFLTVEQLQADNSWKVIKTDANWETKFTWKRRSVAYSEVTIQWDTSDAAPGTYRIQTFGVSRNIFQQLSPYSGASSQFTLTA